MRLSQYLLPVLKENPKEAEITSHRLMLRAGMVRQVSSGIYSWLPLGLKVLRKIERIVREEMELAGAVELLMPTMQPAELWKESGRGDYGKETLRAVDRHGRELIYGPTNEEVITDIFRKNVKSYKNLPLNLFHTQWKFRDEIRPRFGVMRGREFLMKDAYSFDLDEAAAKASYVRMFRAYLRIFKRLGVRAIPFSADTGLIGGNLSHEFQILAKTGESAIYYDRALEDAIDGGEGDVDRLRKFYAMADEKHDPANCNVPADQLVSARGIEVGHIFYLGTKYSDAMGAKIKTAEGKDIAAHMGCYGIGVSRLVGAVIEASHDEKGIIWPENVAPFAVGLVNIKAGDAECRSACETIYATLRQKGVDVLYDDRDESAGTKLASMELIGLPAVIAIGPRGLKDGTAEVTFRDTGTKETMKLHTVANLF